MFSAADLDTILTGRRLEVRLAPAPLRMCNDVLHPNSPIQRFSPIGAEGCIIAAFWATLDIRLL